MQKLDYWRCSTCSVILAENVIVPDRGTVSADCWKCGAVSVLGEATTETLLGFPIRVDDNLPETVSAMVLTPLSDREPATAGLYEPTREVAIKSGKRKAGTE